jgi:hypothetical protein
MHQLGHPLSASQRKSRPLVETLQAPVPQGPCYPPLTMTSDALEP